MWRWRRQTRPQAEAVEAAWDAELAAALRFTPEDLAANREGRLSAAQIAMITPRDVASQAPIIGGFLFFFVLTVLFIPGSWHSLTDGVYNLKDDIAQPGVTAIMAAFAFMCGSAFMWFRYNLAADLREGRAALVEGMIFTEQSVGRYSDRRRVRCGEVGLYLPDESGWAHLRHMGRYRLYYLPRTGLIVSAEVERG